MDTCPKLGKFSRFLGSTHSKQSLQPKLPTNTISANLVQFWTSSVLNSFYVGDMATFVKYDHENGKRTFCPGSAF